MIGAADCETAYAKINLALHVRARRGDGYHQLETVFAFAQDGDRLSVAPAATLSLTNEGDFGEGLSASADNLVMRAATALQRVARVDQGAALRLDKRLPVAAGIGGGSADAAAALRLLMRFWQIELAPEALHALALDLGADVPACLASCSLRGEGIGDTLTPIDDAALPGLALLLVNPGVACPTGPVFAHWDGIDRGALAPGGLAAALAGRNDLEAPARALVPEIDAVLAWLRRLPGARLVRMSGSGATCFALFDTLPALPPLPPHWWSLSTRLR